MSLSFFFKMHVLNLYFCLVRNIFSYAYGPFTYILLKLLIHIHFAMEVFIQLGHKMNLKNGEIVEMFFVNHEVESEEKFY